MSRWTSCAGCAGDKCNSALEGDECQGHIIRPHGPEDGPCPYYAAQGCYPDELPKRDLGRKCAVTRRMAEIIERGINTRKFSHWPVSLYTPTIGEHMSAGECSGVYISTLPYGKRDTIYCRGENYDIVGIIMATIRDNKLILATDTWHGSSVTIDIVDDAPAADRGATVAQVPQKTLGDWA